MDHPSIEDMRLLGLRRLRSADLITWTEVPDPEQLRVVNLYFGHFVAPDPEGKCIRCGLVQGGLMAALLGGFRWGIQYGEGNCSRCHWPARAIHRDVGPIKLLTMILQYHPDDVERREA